MTKSLQRYAYAYAVIDLDPNYYGQCIEVQDTSTYVVRRDYVPIPGYIEDYMEKWYYPVPTSVNSFDDFTGKWYNDQAHTSEATELN